MPEITTKEPETVTKEKSETRWARVPIGLSKWIEQHAEENEYSISEVIVIALREYRKTQTAQPIARHNFPQE